jgi:hypothetical protein
VIKASEVEVRVRVEKAEIGSSDVIRDEDISV